MNPTKKWNIKIFDNTLASEISAGLKMSLPAAKVLVNRGIASLEEAALFVDPDKGALNNPFLLPDMDAAVSRIRRAVDNKEKILVYGDRDVDGVTSICIMIRTLKSLGADPFWYIPSDEGYGVHNEIIERYAKQGVTLIVTVDCGISAVDGVKYAKESGIDVVVTDHHEPAETGMPEAVAVVDAKRADSKYPFTDIAGCAVSFKVCEALMQSFGKYFNKDLVSLTVDEAKSSIFAVKSRNGLLIDSHEFSFKPAAQELNKFINFIMGAILINDINEDIPGRLNLLFQENGLGELSCQVIHLEDYLKKQFSAVNTGAAPDIVPERAKGLSELTPEEKAWSVLKTFDNLEKTNDLRMSFFRENNMDAVALGTIADIMPLVKENRVFVKRGLKQLERTQKIGLKLLIERCVKNAKPGALTAKTVSWSITPVLNAAGRRGKAELSARLLLSDNASESEKLIDEILKLNSERKELQAENLEKFIPLLKSQCDLENDKIFIVVASNIEHGVTGIIASQIMRQYRRPVVLLIIEEGEAMGAARSFEGFDILGAISKVGDILLKYGGHTQAAGLTVAVDKIEEFKTRLKAVADKEISAETLIPSINIDAELEANEANLELIGELSRFEPFGMGNPNPVFSLVNMKIGDITRMGANGVHLKLKVSKNGSASLGAVGWNLGFLEEEIIKQSLVDLAVSLEINTWQDKSSVQLLIEDLKLSEG